MYEQPKPILRVEALTDLQDTIVRQFQTGRVSFPYKNCLNCSNWNEVDEICNKFNSRPPAEIIVYSCKHHIEPTTTSMDDDIPF